MSHEYVPRIMADYLLDIGILNHNLFLKYGKTKRIPSVRLRD